MHFFFNFYCLSTGPVASQYFFLPTECYRSVYLATCIKIVLYLSCQGLPNARQQFVITLY